jgi:tetraacyldisaccharide 4'-kinase
LLFAACVALRRLAYRYGWLHSERLPVPVVVVGNITVGGAGKTPLVIHLAQALRHGGRHPGIVSRGYAGNADEIVAVTEDSDPAQVGDEPILLARRAGCPVFVGRNRAAAARVMLAAHPDINLILADDGLQHYRLARDCEIAVFDRRGVMNGWQLPAGPLREPVSRLASIDAIVLNETGVLRPRPAGSTLGVPTFGHPAFLMHLTGDQFQRLDDPTITCTAAELAGKRLHAVAGIGDPVRFFEHIAALSLIFSEHAFADHHAYRPDELKFDGDAILTTEKDAVKLRQLALSLPVWVLPVTATTHPDLAAFVLEKINGRPLA